MALLKRARAIRERFNLVLAHVDVVFIRSHGGTRRRVVLDSAVEIGTIAGDQIARVVARAKCLVIGTCLGERCPVLLSADIDQTNVGTAGELLDQLRRDAVRKEKDDQLHAITVFEVVAILWPATIRLANEVHDVRPRVHCVGLSSCCVPFEIEIGFERERENI